MESKLIKNTHTACLVSPKWPFLLLALFCVFSTVNAQDDVYDPPKPKKVRQEQVTSPDQYDRVQPYNEDQGIVNDNRTSYYSDDDDIDYGYIGRIRRFHQPSVRFSYGYSFYNDPFYYPYNPYSMWGTYSFTPTWVYSYNNFYNPFWGNYQMIVINDPWMNSWNYGYYSPYSWNYFSPFSTTIFYNNFFPHYHGHYDAGRRNVVYGPRRSNYSNTNPYRNNNSNSNVSPTQNTSPGIIRNQPSSTPPKKWDKVNQTTPQQHQNTYQHNNQGNTPRPTPAQNNNWDNNKPTTPSNDGGIKIGKKPK